MFVVGSWASEKSLFYLPGVVFLLKGRKEGLLDVPTDPLSSDVLIASLADCLVLADDVE